MSTELDVDWGATLNSLTNEQLDHLSLGLEHAFGIMLSGNAGENDFHFNTESGILVALDAKTLTVQDVWNCAEASSR